MSLQYWKKVVWSASMSVGAALQLGVKPTYIGKGKVFFSLSG
jgi:hypothetical protein